jgi:hypothetical protein
MDPRFKLFAIGQWLKCMGVGQSEIDSKLLSLKQDLHQLYESYKSNVVSDIEADGELPNLTSTTLSLDPGSISLPVVRNYSMQSLKRAKVSSSHASSASSSDLQMYLDSATIEVDNDNQFSVLGWWKANEPLYPIVSLMARDLLTIPASTVASESCFSAGGRVVSEKRASLSPSTIEALICLKDWNLAKSRKQDAEQEEQLAEELMNIVSSRPDWMQDIEGDFRNDYGSESETIEDLRS